MDYTTAAASSYSDYDSSSLYSNESGIDTPKTNNQRPVSHTTAITSTLTNTSSPTTTVVQLRRPQSLLPAGSRTSSNVLSTSSTATTTSSYRFSMANLEETHEAELDAILGELSMLEQQKTGCTAALNIGQQPDNSNNGPAGVLHHMLQQPASNRHGHSRTNSMLSHVTNSTISSVSTSSESGNGSGSESNGSSGGCGSGSMSSTGGGLREPHRTESPDNDSAFSDTVSLLSSESSVSSSVSHHKHNHAAMLHTMAAGGPGGHLLPANLLPCDSAKAAKIHLALQKLEQASVRRLFVKAFTTDGASKSLLVDEQMSCGHVTRLLADKNHVTMEPHWALMEQLPDLQMERLFEDHELLVDNLMNWRSDSKNRVLFVQRTDKVRLFLAPERYLPGTQMAPGSEHDDHTRTMLLDEFFASGSTITMEGSLYLKADSKKAWKRHHFVLRASGLYYFLKEKTKSTKDMVCYAMFDDHNVYHGIGWKKKHKAPTDYAFALKKLRDGATTTKDKFPSRSSSSSCEKMLCAEDADTLDRWITAIRVAKFGRRLLDNQRQLVDDLQREEVERFAAQRCGSIGSIVSSVPSQCSSASSSGGGNSASTAASSASAPTGGRLSRASSSSSSGCLSDEGTTSSSIGVGFDAEFPTGTIKRKPSMKPNLPLTSMTRQLKEVGETTIMSGNEDSEAGCGGPAHGVGNEDGDDDDDDRDDDDSNDQDTIKRGRRGLTSPERGGTLTRRHSRRRSEESGSNSGTLKRRPTTVAASLTASVAAQLISMHRGSVDSMSSSSTSNTATPTGSAPGTPLQPASAHNILFLSNAINNNLMQRHLHHAISSPLEASSNSNNGVVGMSDSTYSLPPPPPPPSVSAQTCNAVDTSNMGDLDDLENPNSLTGSTLSLESLPPPPLPSDLQQLTDEFSASQTSLLSLPPPPPEIRPHHYLSGVATATSSALNGSSSATGSTDMVDHMTHPVTHFLVAVNSVAPNHDAQQPPIYAKALKTPASIIKAPPYKAPPPYNNNGTATTTTTTPTTMMMATATTAIVPSSCSHSTAAPKSVSFADSPVMLRRKQVCFEDQVYGSSTRRQPHNQQPASIGTTAAAPTCSPIEPLYVSSAPPPPPRAEATRLSTLHHQHQLLNHPHPHYQYNSNSHQQQHQQQHQHHHKAHQPPTHFGHPSIMALSLSHTSPKRLSDSQANPPPHFLKDLQRVMRKKWQVAQKCKLEPATTPHEVLGFRDFNGELQMAGGTASGFYRETSNVSNWVQEHYGAAAGGGGSAADADAMLMMMADDSLYENLGADMGGGGCGVVVESATSSSVPSPMAMRLLNKRAPPPPPKRSLSTQLSTQHLRS